MVDYFEDDAVFRDIDSFYKRLTERMFREMQGFERSIRDGRLKEQWDIRPIQGPGIRGYTARGHFQLGDYPTRIPRRLTEEKRDPLTDVFEEDENIKIYIELPGVEKEGIQLNVTERSAEVKAGNFFKTVELPSRNVDFEKSTANYKNGVLEITIPKIKKTPSEDEKKRTIKIE